MCIRDSVNAGLAKVLYNFIKPSTAGLGKPRHTFYNNNVLCRMIKDSSGKVTILSNRPHFYDSKNSLTLEDSSIPEIGFGGIAFSIMVLNIS